MVKIMIATLIISVSFQLFSGAFEDKMQQAKMFFDTKAYRDAANAYEEASLEAVSDKARIQAKMAYLNALRKIKNTSGERIAAAQSLLFDEPTLSPDKAVEILEYFNKIANAEYRKNANEFVEKRTDFSGRQRSRVLFLKLDQGGSWTKGVPEEILKITDADPEARASAQGHLGNIELWVNKNPSKALALFEQALATPELNAKNRQFFTLCKARSYIALGKLDDAENLFIQAIKMKSHPIFQHSAYMELCNILAKNNKKNLIFSYLQMAAHDQSLRTGDRKKYIALVEKMNEQIKQHNQQTQP